MTSQESPCEGHARGQQLAENALDRRLRGNGGGELVEPRGHDQPAGQRPDDADQHVLLVGEMPEDGGLGHTRPRGNVTRRGGRIAPFGKSQDRHFDDPALGRGHRPFFLLHHIGHRSGRCLA
jgi:hypothetical protein